MLDMGARNDNVKLVGVVTGSPRGAAVEVEGRPGCTWFVTDTGGNLHRAYRAETEDWLYVIGPWADDRGGGPGCSGQGTGG